MALRYIVENDLNRIIVDAPRPWLGIVAGGHACEQVMEALATLGLDETGSGRGRRARPQARRAVTVRRAVRPPARRRHLDRPRRRGQVAQRRDAGARRAVRRGGPAPGARQAGRRGPAADPAHRRAHRRGPGRAAAPRADDRAPTRAPGAGPDRGQAGVHAQPAGRPHAVLLLGLPPQHRHPRARRAPWSAPASAATGWSASWAAAREGRSPGSRRWAARAASGSASRRSSPTPTCSRTWATARSSTPASSRCRRPSRPASTSPSSCSTTRPSP